MQVLKVEDEVMGCENESNVEDDDVRMK